MRRQAIGKPRKVLSPGVAFEVTPAEAGHDGFMRIRLCKFITQKRGSVAARPFMEMEREVGVEMALDALWCYLNDWGSWSGLVFDCLNIETVDADGVARYGWTPADCEKEGPAHD